MNKLGIVKNRRRAGRKERKKEREERGKKSQ